MRAELLRTIGLLTVLQFGIPARAETYTLSESLTEGDQVRVTIETHLSGTLKVTREGKPATVRVTARNEHAFAERVLASRNGVIRRTARLYDVAHSRATVDGNPVERMLPTDRRLVVAQRTGDSLLCYSPAGPLARPALEVVSEHFETLHLSTILSGKPVAVGDSWKLESSTAQSVCLFEGLIRHDLTARLTQVNGSVATIAIAGNATGVENGALANLTVEASVKYDLNRRRIVEVDWKQKDVREQGPVTPAADIETTTKIKRDDLGSASTGLTGTVLAAIPSADDPPAEMKCLTHRDSKGRYQFLYSRDWYIVGQTDHHLVMRLLERGDFVAQATITPWTRAADGKHMTPEEFEKLTAGGTGWKLEEVLERQEMPADPGRWVYRVIARGNLEGTSVVQAFYVVAVGGEQTIVTFTMKPAAAGRLNSRDLTLVNALEFLRP